MSQPNILIVKTSLLKLNSNGYWYRAKEKLEKWHLCHLEIGHLVSYKSQKGWTSIFTTVQYKGQLISKCLFGVFNFFQKNERKQVNLRYHSTKVEFICSFFGRIVVLKKSLRLCLTFNFCRFFRFSKLEQL